MSAMAAASSSLAGRPEIEAEVRGLREREVGIKAELAAGNGLPREGIVFLSVNDQDKPAGLVVAQRLPPPVRQPPGVRC